MTGLSGPFSTFTFLLLALALSGCLQPTEGEPDFVLPAPEVAGESPPPIGQGPDSVPGPMGTDPGPDALPDPGPETGPDFCDALTLLPNEGEVTLAVSLTYNSWEENDSISTPRTDTCWAERDDSVAWVAYRKLVVPPWTGVIVDGSMHVRYARNLGIEVVEGCSVDVGPTCQIYEELPQARESLSANYVSNATEEERVYLLRIEIEDGPARCSTPGEIRLQMRSVMLSAYAGLRCEAPSRAEPSVRLWADAVGLRAGTEASYGQQYYELDVPAMSAVVRRGGGTLEFRGCDACPCEGRRELLNDTDLPQTMIAVRELDTRTHELAGWDAAPLAENARCDGAWPLTQGSAALGLQDQGGLSGVRCDVNASRPLYYRAIIPAGRQAEVTLTPSLVADRKLYIALTDGCDVACLGASESAYGAENHTLIYDNPGDTDIEITLAVGAVGIVADDLELSVLFTLTEPPL